MKRRTLDEKNNVLNLFSIEEMENICYDVFVNIIQYIDNKDLLSLCSTCKNLYDFGEKLAKQRPDFFTIFIVDRNIRWSCPIQDDCYYSGEVKIIYLNPKTKKKWTTTIENENALERFSTRKFYSNENWILRYAFESGIKKLSPNTYGWFVDEKLYQTLSYLESQRLKKEIYSWN